ncbi:MAG: aspartate kinase [Raineya sp.]|nr:aspartate kinase [Raineya sp.]
MQVFKFGGASVKDAEAVRNVAYIIQNFGTPTHLVVVVSAMGKTTNALEKLLHTYFSQADWQNELQNIQQYHWEIAQKLFPNNHIIFTALEYLFLQLKEALLHKTNPEKYDESYDQVICFGEIIATHIVSQYLQEQAIANEWIDIRNYIKTDTTWREGKVDFAWTEQLIRREILPILQEKIVVTQGFLGGTLGNKTTTLGREGSDYTASIIAYSLNAEKVTIWKDVPGILNADPKKVPQTQLYETLSYTEASEMTFYGANVIHPKTIKPLANKNIPLFVRSFLEPTQAGTCINGIASQQNLPTIIFKPNQVLLKFGVKDLAFITEENLAKILHTFTQVNAKINLMQSSAVSIWIVTDFQEHKILKIKDFLSEDFTIFQENHAQLLTILYYDEKTLNELLPQYHLILEQKTAQTFRAVVKEKS